jgi:hypothetical protein
MGRVERVAQPAGLAFIPGTRPQRRLDNRHFHHQATSKYCIDCVVGLGSYQLGSEVESLAKQVPQFCHWTSKNTKEVS